MKIVFLLTHIPNPRMNKRIELLRQEHSVSVVCARRKSQSFYNSNMDGVEYRIKDIDIPPSGQLLKRYAVSFSFSSWASGELELLQPELIYAESLDSLMIAGKYKKNHAVHIIYEVADLRDAYTVKPKNPVKRTLTELILLKERREFKNVELLVVTSPRFYDVHFSTLISKEKTLFIPNAPNKAPFSEYRKKTSGDFTVGFIGGIRYLNQMKMLVDAAGEAGCRVLFAGGSDTDDVFRQLQSYCQGKDYVSFSGKFNFDKEIAGLYGRTDCVFVVYDADNPNARALLPNKLYESVLCELPLISAKGTYLGELTEQWGVGLTVSHTDTAQLCEALKKLRDDRELYNSLAENCRAVQSSISSESGNACLLKVIEEMDLKQR